MDLTSNMLINLILGIFTAWAIFSAMRDSFYVTMDWLRRFRSDESTDMHALQGKTGSVMQTDEDEDEDIASLMPSPPADTSTHLTGTGWPCSADGDNGVSAPSKGTALGTDTSSWVDALASAFNSCSSTTSQDSGVSFGHQQTWPSTVQRRRTRLGMPRIIEE